MDRLMATRREAAQSLARTRDLLSVAALNAHQADEVPAVLADDVEARALARGGPAHGGRSAAGRGAGPMKYSVRITRLPIEDEPRKQMEAAGTLPENYARRLPPVDDYVAVHTDSWPVTDSELIELALANTRLGFLPQERAWFRLEWVTKRGIDRRELGLVRVVAEAGSRS